LAASLLLGCDIGREVERVPESRDNSLPSLSLVIPAYNEAKRIEATLTTVEAYLANQPYAAEVLLVDDGSLDFTVQLARQFAERHPMVKVISIDHAGKAIAVRSGMRAASGDLIAFSDADLATPITFLEPFRQAIRRGADVVIGSREGAGAERIGEPRFRHLMGRVFNLIVRVLLLRGVPDSQCGFKLFTRQATAVILDESLLYRDDSNRPPGPRVTAFDVEMLVIARRNGFHVVIQPVSWTFGEQSKVDPFTDTITNLRDVLTVKWNDLRGRYRVRH
jgi:dolichyl-phosphate beta-glucosyltransferase